MATFFNQATLVYNNNIISSNITTGEIQEALTLTKNAVQNSYAQGDDITYVIQIRNTASTAYNALTLTDNLGEYTLGALTLVPLTLAEGSVTLFIDGILQPQPVVTAGPPLTITGISIPAGALVTLLYTAQINSFAPLDIYGTITNTVILDGPAITAAAAEETVTAAEEASLSIIKSLSPAIVPESGRITYTFVIQNTGNTAVVATDDAIITDLFNPVLSNLTVTFNGAPWTAPLNYTYNPVTGLFSTSPGQITVPAATFIRDPATGATIIQPGSSTLTVSGNI